MVDLQSLIVDGHGRSITDQLLALAGTKLRLLVPQMRIDYELLHLGEGKLLLGQEVINALRIVRRDIVDLREILLLFSFVSKRNSHMDPDSILAYLNYRILHEPQHISSVLDGILPLLLGHDARPKLGSLCVVVLLALVPVVALAAHHIVRDLIRCLGSIWSEFVCETVRCVLLVASVVGVGTHCIVKVQRGI